MKTFCLSKFHFLQFEKWPKINFWTGKKFKTAKNAISRKICLIYLISRVFSALTFLNFLAPCALFCLTSYLYWCLLSILILVWIKSSPIFVCRSFLASWAFIRSKKQGLNIFQTMFMGNLSMYMKVSNRVTNSLGGNSLNFSSSRTSSWSQNLKPLGGW